MHVHLGTCTYIRVPLYCMHVHLHTCTEECWLRAEVAERDVAHAAKRSHVAIAPALARAGELLEKLSALVHGGAGSVSH